ncbi:diaminopimelate epimerase [Actinomyces sp. 2119]|uniref:Diaminopimelate epimerase n=2 Tax=Actinomycetaceae TaxID=2049 RepID=A0ABM6Z6M8_9ACTO|nr:diaminopimelate epimerase [Actinomyces lilanjuaniae]RJF42649.1 diaminopimelate epimerase [Actinomyces sp. 2119]
MSGLAGHELVKGHATLNDFLVLVDPDCEIELSVTDVVAVCDRRGGIGADGFIRVVRTSALPGAKQLASAAPEARWFMDCYAADGSVLGACGNAARLFARVLETEGLEPLGDGDSVTIGTRAGARTVTRLGDLWTVDMGPTGLARAQEAQAEGWDTAVVVPGLEGARAGLSVTVSSPHVPHVVVALGEESELEAAELDLRGSAAPVRYEPEPVPGVSLDLVVPLGEETDPATGQVVSCAQVRVLGRGAQEVLSSGTGCCAAAVALHQWAGETASRHYQIRTRGGHLGVHVEADPLAEDAALLLTGPAAVTGRVRVA